MTAAVAYYRIPAATLVERELGRGGMATVITHFGSWFYRDIPTSIPQIAALGDGVRTSAACDGLVINV